jgi:hypothetical protein
MSTSPALAHVGPVIYIGTASDVEHIGISSGDTSSPHYVRARTEACAIPRNAKVVNSSSSPAVVSQASQQHPVGALCIGQQLLVLSAA